LRLWAYTDGSCLTYKRKQRVGAGVFLPATKTATYVKSGAAGISNTINRAELTGINRAELTGIASALRAKCAHIATDSACSLRYRNKSYFLNYTGSTHIASFWNKLSP